VFDAAIPPLGARHYACEEFHDTPVIDKGFSRPCAATTTM
jgi:formylmethanofuran dehydrogenase subunit A